MINWLIEVWTSQLQKLLDLADFLTNLLSFQYLKTKFDCEVEVELSEYELIGVIVCDTDRNRYLQ